MKTYERVDLQIHIFLISALVGGEWLASCPCRFTPGEEVPCTHWTVGWVGPNQFGRCGVEKNLASTETRTPIPRTSSS
jgi:hypothetical protein